MANSDSNNNNPEPAPEWMLPEFDPSLVKVSELRSILLQNNIPHSYTRKSDLIQLFERDVRPLTPKLLREHQSVRPSAHGIIDMRTGGLLQPQDVPPKKTPRKKASSNALADQELSSTPSGYKRRVTTKKPIAITAEFEEIGTDADADAESTPHSRASSRAPKVRRSAINPPVKRKQEDRVPSAEEEEVDELARDEQTHNMDLDRSAPTTVSTTRVARQGASSSASKSTNSPVPTKRRKSDFPIQASTIKSPSEDTSQLPKKKSSKPKNRRTTLHEVIEAGEGNYSDFNPFQSGPDDDKSGGSGKKPKTSKRSSSAARPSLAPAQLPKSSTTSNLPRLESPSKANRINARTSIAPIHEPESHMDPEPRGFLPKSATTSNVRASMTPQQIFGSRAGTRLLDHQDSPDFGTPEQILRQLVPSREHRRHQPSEKVEVEDDQSSSAEARHPYFEDHNPSRTRRQSQLPPRSPYPPRPSLPSSTTPALQRVRLSELVHTPGPEKKLRINRPTPRPRAGPGWSFSQLLSFILRLGCLAGMLGVLNWYRSQSLELGYCDTGSNTNGRTRDRAIERVVEGSEGVSQIVEVASSLGILPDCTGCPAHAICEKGELRGCEVDYVLTQSLFGSWVNAWMPMIMGPKCLPDTAKLVKIAERAHEILQVLKVKRGSVVCGMGMAGVEAEIDEKTEVRAYGMPERELKERVLGTQKVGEMDEEIFRLALKDLEKYEEVVVLEGWYATGNSKSMEMSWKCRMKLGMYKLIKRFKLILMSLVCIGVGWIYLKLKLHRISEEKKKVKELVEITLTKLRDESWVHHTNPTLKPNAFIASAHLRDLILSYEHSPIARQKLWKKVETIIEGNSNIRTKLSEQRGENIKVWEWIGSYTGDLNLNSSPTGRYTTPNRSDSRSQLWNGMMGGVGEQEMMIGGG
ncbi:hypothetical protein CROQUDRAFT_70914 [Cronartium quercuum f. sp. fusiforme G11]|uniref:Man1/Src1-like C-terminal domain-containing protein n=1 Tax=Cronartium quercuum f. sp. fusiforme G11 TaxID=708437 RepID=A0A9P6TH35_9BASI|nr:hypothetical protein CROQUDRAFT_70914 [Cronartium quercuum f. sp. fusiforme G11]